MELVIAFLGSVPASSLVAAMWNQDLKGEPSPLNPEGVAKVADRMLQYIMA